MDVVLVEFGLTFAAFGLFLFTIMSFFTGAAFSSGSTVRSFLTPSLKSFRSTSPKKRDDLADSTVLVGVLLAVCAAFVTLSIGAAFVAFVLWRSRPQIRRLTRSEHPLMSLGSDFSADFVIGLIAPLAMMHLLLGNPLLALSLSAAIVALCWPAGGAGRSVGRWSPSWVAG